MAIQQVLVAKRLGQKFHRARLHGPHRHGDVTVAVMKMIGIG